MKHLTKPEFWVTNVSPRNVTLADLAINIRAFTTVNLLDKKHYDLTLEQLLKSKETGSLFKKKDKIITRHLPPPQIEKDKMSFLSENGIPSRARSILTINEIEYDELKVATDKENQKQLDEEYARENADLVEADAQKIVTSRGG